MKDAIAASYWKNDLKKIQALNGIRTHDLCVTGAKLYQAVERSCLGSALNVQWTSITTLTFAFRL